MELINYSFIIPHHNTPDLLQRCIDSIPERDDIQIIVVDDNSDEGKKPKIVRDDVQIYLLNSDQSKGAGRARNIGIEKAKGKWLLFADSDDFFSEEMYEIISEYSNSSYDMIMFKANSVDSETLLPSDRDAGINRSIDSYLNGLISAQVASLEVHSPWCRMIKKNFVINNNLKFDEVIASNDTMFTTKVSCLAKSIGVSNRILYTVTFRQGSLWNSRKNADNYLARIEVYIRRKQYLSSIGINTPPMIIPLLKMGYVDFYTNLKAFLMVYRSGFLFQNTIGYLKKLINRKFSQKNEKSI